MQVAGKIDLPLSYDPCRKFILSASLLTLLRSLDQSVTRKLSRARLTIGSSGMMSRRTKSDMLWFADTYNAENISWF